VLGDRDGTTCEGAFTQLVATSLRRGGWDVPMSSYQWQFQQMQRGRGILVFDDGWHKLATAIWLFGAVKDVFAMIDATDSVAGPRAIARDTSGDALGLLGTQVLGVGLDKLVIIAVLTSAAASTQTTILPTARTSLSMARAKAMPASLGRIHPRFLTPHVSTIWMGSLSIVWYVGLTIVSENILFDSIAAHSTHGS
jgi:amino acid transporter